MVINGNYLWAMSPIKDMRADKVIENGVSYGLSEAGYDIRIKQEVEFSPRDPRAYTSYDTWARDSDSGIGRFVIASAIEEFQMPIDMVAVVHDKSTWARKGLSVFNTVIEPGWNGFLTLELVYHGKDDLYIPAGSGIAQVLFHKLSNPARYNGKYRNQEDKPVEAIYQGK